MFSQTLIEQANYLCRAYASCKNDAQGQSLKFQFKIKKMGSELDIPV